MATFVNLWDKTPAGQAKRVCAILKFVRAARSPRFSHSRKPYYTCALCLYRRNPDSPTGVELSASLPADWVDSVATRFNLLSLRQQSPTFEDRRAMGHR